MTKELIKIETTSDGKRAVSARELHKFLGSKQDFSNWIKNRIEKYDFVENQDYRKVYFDVEGNLLNISLNKNIETENQRIMNAYKIEYVLSIETAKELCMIENNEQGRKARRYFIECEKKLKEISKEDYLLVNVINAKGKENTALALKEYREQIVLPLRKELNEANETIEHKKEVISYMTSDFKLQTQRQFLNEIIRMKGNANNLISERWKILYGFYEKQKHINLQARFEAYNLIHKPKLKSKLQLIDDVLNDIPSLYKIAVKVFEADFKDKLQHYLSVL